VAPVDVEQIEETTKILNQPDGSAIANARATIENLEDLFGPILNTEEKDEADTIAGLIFYLTGRIAKRGEVIRHNSGLEFEILEADPRRLKTVRILRPRLEETMTAEN